MCVNIIQDKDMGKISIGNVQQNNNQINILFNVSDDLKEYFNDTESMKIEYSMDIGIVPKSLMVIPFLCNVLPIIWITNSELNVDEVDKCFFEQIENIKNGYEKMYPMLQFKGSINVGNVIDNSREIENGNVACFFSGGVDAYTTLYRHLDEKPILVTVWGADIKLADKTGWSNVSLHTKQVAKEFGLEYIFIKSNFREIVNEPNLDHLVVKSNDMWWHGFQSGISLIGHMSVIAWEKNLSKDYIASSFPEYMKGKYTCASDPTIDNYVRFANCHTVHDGYELDRQQKINYIVDETNKRNSKTSLRVCWISSGGLNCCKCEKCYRTILELISEGGNPNEYGFKWRDKDIKRCEKDFKYKIVSSQFNINQYYPSIQKAFLKNRHRIESYDSYKWLVKMDFNKKSDFKSCESDKEVGDRWNLQD